MSPVRESLEASLVRIHTADGRVVGAGFLVGERQILTCAHVVSQALGLADSPVDPPHGLISLDFPLIPARYLTPARVVQWYPPQPDGRGDIAGLELQNEPPTGAEVVRFAPAEDLWEHSFRAFGFPAGYDDGVWATGRLLGRQATDWVMIEYVKAHGFSVTPGFSGTPVWDTQLQGVVGMVVAASRPADTNAAFVLPLDVLMAAWTLIEPITRQRVFLSAAPADAAFADRLATDLEARDIMVWSEQHTPGEQQVDQEERVRQAIRAAQAVVLVMSSQTRSSRIVKEHLRLADLYQRRLIFVWGGDDEHPPTPPAGGWRETIWVDARPSQYAAALDAIEAALGQRRSISALLSPSGAAAEEASREPRNPYKGLRAFTTHDAGDFFGRERMVYELVKDLAGIVAPERSTSDSGRLLAIIGPSGSGKSSLVMAGLLPRLQHGALPGSEMWVYLDPMVPGNDPIDALILTLAAHFPDRSFLSIREILEHDDRRGLHLLATQLVKQRESKVVLLVDQFEELFTQTESEDERRRFIDLLLTAVIEPRGSLIVLLTLRADFSDRPMQYPELGQLIERQRRAVFSMEIDELRATIEQPAALPDVQLSFEGNLVGDILFELRGQVGALPLLEFTLEQLFELRSDHRLTLQAYHAIGGVTGALSRHAEQTYAALPSEEHRRLARALFLRLIDPGTTEQDVTRRRAALSEFSLPDATTTLLLRETADAFIAARLLTTNEVAGTTTIEVSHQALIQEWPRLSDWLREARADLRLQRIISEDAAEWERRGKPKDWLYRGARLAEAQAWMRRNLPSRNEVAFLEASAGVRGSLTQRLRQTLTNITGRLRTDRSNIDLQKTSSGDAQEQEPLTKQTPRVMPDLERVPTPRWYLHLELPALPAIQVGQALPFTLHLTADEQPDSSPLRIPLNALELAVYIEAPGFHLEGEQPRSLSVVDGRPEERSLPVQLIPVASGTHTVRILVYPGGQVEGLEPSVVIRTISVAAPVTLPNIPELLDRGAIPNPQPDVILYLSLEEVLSSQQVQILLTCPALGLDRELLEPLPLTQTDLAWLRQAAVQAAADAANAAPSDVLTSLRAVGSILFDQLMPRNHRLRTLYRQIGYLASSSPTPWSWLVVADERAVLPWELICPYRRQETAEVWYDDFLADQFVLAHWVGRQGLPLRAEAPLGWLALDHYHQRPLDLPHWHATLADKVLDGYEDLAGHLALTQPGSPYYGLHVLRYTDADQVGRITYGGEKVPGAGSPQNEAEAMLYNQRLDFTLRRPVLCLSLIDGQPAGLGLRLSQRDTHLEAGWLVPFMHAGATALVGPRWPVLSEVDQLFFQIFYQSIRTGSPLGWALGDARAQIKQTFPHRADWLAYTYFGHPWCQLYQVRLAQGFTLFEVLDHPVDAPFEAGRSYRFRASYRTEAPLWYNGQLQVQQAPLQGEDVSVLVMPLTGAMPETYQLKPVPAGNDYQCIVTLTMPQEETTLPVLIRFQKGAQELHTLILNLDVSEKKGSRI